MILCRSEGELDGWPKTIQTICVECGSPKFCGYPRWTIENKPRFVIPRLLCKGCNGKYRNFKPVGNWETINSTVLSKFWTKVADEKFDPRIDPALRSRFLGNTGFSTMKEVLKRIRKRHLVGSQVPTGQKRKSSSCDEGDRVARPVEATEEKEVNEAPIEASEAGSRIS
ncbi:hypothetical protein BDW59DRAFT_56436 [Aspergillus cavernicola]|uniref:Uncharacterized protein n=1 Tax=Aspergillus cavernicola TaxID=176166 RepID=A0ABR4IIN0_9EURO